MFLDPITPLDIINIVNILKTSQCHDNISCKILKTSINYILIPLTHIINKSLASGIVPDNMKVARLINSYRPISILPAFSKINRKLIKYIEYQNLLFPHQYGFPTQHHPPNYTLVKPNINCK